LEDIMRYRVLAGLTVAGAMLLAACGGGGSSAPQAAASGGGGARTHPATAAAHPATAAAVTVRTTRLGDVLADAKGRTLYAFINDTNGVSTCTGVCAATWPPLTVTADWTAGSGIDRANFHTIANGASAQLVAGRWPLYRFAGDSRPGDVNGQGLESFYVVRPDGSLFKGTSAHTSTPNPMPAMSGSGY
jgi:predicted lipoprotein with Yx(FWY)xxD motif